MSTSTTIAVNGRVYDMGSEERAREAAEWLYDHPGEASQFEDHFSDAKAMTTPLGGGLRAD